MKAALVGIVIAVLVFFGIQMFTPFPYGLILGCGLSGFIIWYALKQTSTSEHSLISYRRTDPQTDEEKRQNREAYRILKKKFLEEKISKEEFEKQKKFFNVDND